MKAMNRILGFLVGMGVTNHDEDVNIKHGEHKWEEFIKWWHKEDVEIDVLCDLIEYLAERYIVAGSLERKRLDSFIDFIVDKFGEDVDEDNDEE